MYCVYVLQSTVQKNWLYIGFSANINERLKEHHAGRVKSTKPKLPLLLVYYEAYKNETDARKREKHLKTHQQRDFLKNRLQNSLIK